MIDGQIQDILEYFNFSGPSKLDLKKLWKCEYSFESNLFEKYEHALCLENTIKPVSEKCPEYPSLPCMNRKLSINNTICHSSILFQNGKIFIIDVNFNNTYSHSHKILNSTHSFQYDSIKMQASQLVVPVCDLFMLPCFKYFN